MKSLILFFGGFDLSVSLCSGDKSGVFSRSLLHVHGETACILHVVVDLHHWHISDALDSFSTESICMYSATVL